MKTIYPIFLFILITISTNTYAKKVKFAVDMTGQTVSVNGVHIAGDFQTLAGDTGGDWNSATTKLTKEGNTEIYSTVVNIPAFRKYEYKFVNGDQFYESEFVPEESRVGYNFNDNRWLYIDSMSDDTTFVGAIMFSGNAPLGLKLLRFKVDMNGKTVANDGVHLAADFNAWNLTNLYMYRLGDKVHEIIQYLDSSKSYEYYFVNGESSSGKEVVPSACASNSNRKLTLSIDTVLPVVCFSECSACNNVGIQSAVNETPRSIYPNPIAQDAVLHVSENLTQIYIYDMSGQQKEAFVLNQTSSIRINHLPKGMYILKMVSEEASYTEKLIIE